MCTQWLISCLLLGTTANTIVDCDFQSSLCGWSISSSIDDTRPGWTRKNSGGTPSVNTGPSAGRGGSGGYAFIETSYGSRDDVFSLSSPVMDLGATAMLTFYYHMYGANIGALTVKTNDTTPQLLTQWTISGEQDYLWHAVSVRIPQNTTHIVIEATKGGASYTGDIAIDDIELVTIDDILDIVPVGMTAMTAPPVFGFIDEIKHNGNVTVEQDNKDRRLSVSVWMPPVPAPLGNDLYFSFDVAHDDSSWSLRSSCSYNWQTRHLSNSTPPDTMVIAGELVMSYDDLDGGDCNFLQNGQDVNFLFWDGFVAASLLQVGDPDHPLSTEIFPVRIKVDRLTAAPHSYVKILRPSTNQLLEFTAAGLRSELKFFNGDYTKERQPVFTAGHQIYLQQSVMDDIDVRMRLFWAYLTSPQDPNTMLVELNVTTVNETVRAVRFSLTATQECDPCILHAVSKVSFIGHEMRRLQQSVELDENVDEHIVTSVSVWSEAPPPQTPSMATPSPSMATTLPPQTASMATTSPQTASMATTSPLQTTSMGTTSPPQTTTMATTSPPQRTSMATTSPSQTASMTTTFPPQTESMSQTESMAMTSPLQTVSLAIAMQMDFDPNDPRNSEETETLKRGIIAAIELPDGVSDGDVTVTFEVRPSGQRRLQAATAQAVVTIRVPSGMEHDAILTAVDAVTPDAVESAVDEAFVVEGLLPPNMAVASIEVEQPNMLSGKHSTTTQAEAEKSLRGSTLDSTVEDDLEIDTSNAAKTSAVAMVVAIAFWNSF